MNAFDDYGIKYPDLVMEILDYFRLGNGAPATKSVKDFCERNSLNGQIIYQPEIVDRICLRLVNAGVMSCLRVNGALGLHNNYGIVISDKNKWKAHYEELKHQYNSIVYGFEYVYSFCKEAVIPIVGKTNNGTLTVATCFEFQDGIVTARHCIEDVKTLAIKGYEAEELKRCKIYAHPDEGIDIVFIHTQRPAKMKFFCADGHVLDNVLTMGFPKIPTFTNFVTAEKATISSKAEGRRTSTCGAIAAIGTQYLTKSELMLITAKIRGGNSGGPVMNELGNLIGIACGLPDYETSQGDYDDLGYGIVTPIKYLLKILSEVGHNTIPTLQTETNFFVDYPN